MQQCFVTFPLVCLKVCPLHQFVPVIKEAKPNKCWVLAFPAVMQESPPPPSPALPPGITPVSEACWAGLLPQARSCIRAPGCRMSQEGGEAAPRGVCATPLSELTASFCLRSVPGVLWTVGNGQEWEGIRSLPGMLPTYPSCLQHWCEAAYTGYTCPWLLCASRSAWAAHVQFCSPLSPRASLCELCLTPAFHHHPCSEHPAPSFLGLPVPAACRVLQRAWGLDRYQNCKGWSTSVDAAC